MGKKFMWVDSAKAERELGYTHGAASRGAGSRGPLVCRKGLRAGLRGDVSNRMSANPVEFGFVAALEREVSGLVRGWSTD